MSRITTVHVRCRLCHFTDSRRLPTEHVSGLEFDDPAPGQECPREECHRANSRIAALTIVATETWK